MIALALEMSSRQGSLALLVNGRLRAERSWMDEGARSQNVFQVLDGLLREINLAGGDIDTFIVGRGPGSYTGLRVAMTTAQALALPRGDTVHCFSSGAALAAERFTASDARDVAVVGDARRGQLWVGLYQRGPLDDDVVEKTTWTLAQPGDLPALLPSGALVVSPDWEKMKDTFRTLMQIDSRWVEKNVYPQAGWLGRVGLRRMQKGVPSEAPTPIYLHDAVMAKV